MGWKFWQRDENPMDPQRLLAQAHDQQAQADTWPKNRPPEGGDVPFRMTIEDVFSISGRGTIVTGRVEAGVIRKGQSVTVSRDGQQLGTTVVAGLETFRKTLEQASLGDNVGLQLENVQRDQVARGDVLSG